MNNREFVVRLVKIAATVWVFDRFLNPHPRRVRQRDITSYRD